MKTFSKEIRESMFKSSNGYCQCSRLCAKRVTEFHHKFPNTEVNNNLYPLFMQSPFNCLPINTDCHMTKPKIKIEENLVIAYEEYLCQLVKEK